MKKEGEEKKGNTKRRSKTYVTANHFSSSFLGSGNGGVACHRDPGHTVRVPDKRAGDSKVPN